MQLQQELLSFPFQDCNQLFTSESNCHTIASLASIGLQKLPEMSAEPKLFTTDGAQPTDLTSNDHHTTHKHDAKGLATVEAHPHPSDGSASPSNASWDSDDSVDKEAQAGVQSIEATAVVWTTTSLIIAYIMIWIVYFVDSMQQGATGTLTPYVTSAFQKHSLTPTVNIMSNIIGGVFKLTLAKILDVFGRPQGFLLSVFFTTLGLVMMAACRTVSTYAAAQVFYWVGMNGISYSLSVTLADMSSLRNRGLALAFATSPYIITAWLSGPISESFLNGPGFRWAFGSFSIVTPVVTTPLFILFMYNLVKAKRLGVLPMRAKSGRTVMQCIMHYCREFDIIGILLLSAGIALFLLPFNIYSYQKDQWRAPIIICFLILGPVLIVAFAVWEKWYAPVKFIPYELLLDRTVLFSCVLAATSFVSYFIWDAYFFSFLQVVPNLSFVHATYVTNIYNVGSCLWSLVTGIFLRYTGRFKPAVLYFGLPLTTIGVGTMIKFRHPDVNIGYIIMSQIFVAFGGGTNVVSQEVAIMSAAKHQHVAVVLAIQAMAASIGGAIGLSISAAIWQAIFPVKLKEYLPAESLSNFDKIYGELTEQLKYPVGSATRTAIQKAYGDSQQTMLIAATAVLAIGFVAVALWRDVNVKNIKQVKGRVF